MCEASWRYSDSSVGPSCTRSATDRGAQLGDDRRRRLAGGLVAVQQLHSARSGRRIRITRADSTGSPSTSTSSPGRRWSPSRTSRPSRSARSSRSRTWAAWRPSRTASATRRPVRPHSARRAPRDVEPGRSTWRRLTDLALGVAGAAAPAATPPTNHDGPTHHAPSRSRRTARDSSPVASPAALIIGTDSVVRAIRPERAAVALIASTEPRTRSKRSRSWRAVVHRPVGLGGRGPQVVQQRGRSRPAARRPQRAATRACRGPARSVTARAAKASTHSTTATISASSPAVTRRLPRHRLCPVDVRSCARATSSSCP